MRKTLIAAVAVVASLVIVPSAFAWGGAKINSVSCPEVHVNLPVESGPWKVLAVDEAGHTLVNVNVPGSASEQVIGGLWTLDNATHQVTVTVGNAANINDGKVVRTTQLTNCASPLGAPGPAGPAGPVGPAGPAGAAGKDGVTTTILITQTEKRSCSVSHRKVHLTLPKAMRNVRSVRAILGGRHRILPVRNGKVTLNFSGMRCGQYAVRLIKKNVGHVQLLYTLGGERDGGGNLTAYNLPPRS